MTETAEAAPPLGLHALYRYFDAKGRLLYVGISTELTARNKAHVKGSGWAQFAVGSTIEHCKGETKAREAEEAAIKTEQPIFNKTYNNTPEARDRLRAYLEEVGRLDLLPDWRTAAEKAAAAPVGAGFPKVLNTAKLAAAIKALIWFREIDVEVVAAETGLSASTITRLSQGQKPDADALVTLLAWLKADGATFAAPRTTGNGET